ncbi:MAG: hypothetical protein WD942_07695 [Dehalococcoidia bacterium]
MEPRVDWYDLVDDFYPVMGLLDTVLIARDRVGSELHAGVAAAIAAAARGIKSLDWARQAHVQEEDLQWSATSVHDSDLLRRAYATSLTALREARGKLAPTEAGATLGEFAASVALERFPQTLKSIHMLYRMGHRVDGDTVARAGLEQLAWALAASTAASRSDLETVKSTASITALRQLYPAAGRLYGRLSQSAHMDVAEHLGLVSTVSGRSEITTREDTLQWGSLVLLNLGDAWLAVWEVTQQAHLSNMEHVTSREGQLLLADDRPFAQRAVAVSRDVQARLANRTKAHPTDDDY